MIDSKEGLNAGGVEVHPVQLPEINYKYLDKQWLVVTELARRALVDKNPIFLEIAHSFIDKPVTQNVAPSFIAQLAEQFPEVQERLNRYPQLQTFLNTPAVDEKFIGSDFASAEMSIVLGENWLDELHAAESLELGGMFGLLSKFAQARKDPEKGPKLKQLKLAQERYKLARDVKLFALGAELAFVAEPHIDEAGSLVLPSGTKLFLDEHFRELESDFLHPEKWEKRRQIKDRVYEIEINGRKYMLKEQKTTRHRDLPKPYKPSLSPQEEFEIAREFNKRVTFHSEHVDLRWEVPICHVQFPDGYAFSLFQHEEGIVEERQVYNRLVDIVKAQRGYSASTSPREAFNIMGEAGDIMNEARDLYDLANLKLGYRVTDNRDLLYKIEGQRLVAIGIDFEYHQKMTPEEHAQLIKDESKRRKKGKRKNDTGRLRFESMFDANVTN